MSAGDDSDGGDIDIASGSLFTEPDGFYAPDKPASFCHHDTRAGERLRVRLVGQSPLWVWPSTPFSSLQILSTLSLITRSLV